MPDSVIKQVGILDSRDRTYGNLSFANCHGDLFPWNDEVYDEHNQMLVEQANPHLDIPAELPEVLHKADLPITTDPMIDEDEIPGVMEWWAATNAGLLDDDTNNMPAIVPADDDEIDPDAPDNDDNVGILEAGVIPPATLAPEDVVNIADKPSAASQEWHNATDTKQQQQDDTADDTLNANANTDTTGVSDSNDTSKSDEETKGPRHSQYCLVYHAKKKNDCEPILREIWEEFNIGIVLQQYSIKARLKKFGTKGEKAVMK